MRKLYKYGIVNVKRDYYLNLVTLNLGNSKKMKYQKNGV